MLLARDALYAESTAAHEQADVPRGSEQTHGSHEKVHPSRDSIL